MMRPDLLFLSLLAVHQAVSLPQSATNLSDYISLSREALQQASVYQRMCVCWCVLGGGRALWSPISSSLFSQQQQVPVVFLACPPNRTDQPLSGLCVAEEASLLPLTCDSPYCHLTERSHYKETESFQSFSLLVTVNV